MDGRGNMQRHADTRKPEKSKVVIDDETKGLMRERRKMGGEGG